MLMSPWLRKLTLTAHVTLSVAWLGAVTAFLSLALAGLNSDDSAMVRASYLGMALIAWYVILPLNAAALFTGLIQALGTEWGLFRHYWVLIKFLITVVCTALLLLHMRPVSYLADVVIETSMAPGDHQRLRVQLVADAAGAIIALLVVTALSIYKPRGLTRYGWRKQRAERGGG